MTIPLRALAEINHEAIRILSREIGLANTIRFINQFTTGMGITQQSGGRCSPTCPLTTSCLR